MSILDEIPEQEKIDAMTSCPKPVGEKEFLERIIKEDKKYAWYDTFVAGGLAVGIVIIIILVFFANKEFSVKTKEARQHIESVIATDKNCNDCHLGASFVNLFNHPAVKGNDNTVLLMMDKAKIKRW